jgi:superfamily II DNA/RNA helicase
LSQQLRRAPAASVPVAAVVSSQTPFPQIIAHPGLIEALHQESTAGRHSPSVETARWYHVHHLSPAIRPFVCVRVCVTTEISRPTDIQARAIPPLLEGRDVLMAGQTGTGKTLAYLLPLIQRLKHDEDHGGIVARPSRPRIVIVAPTRELAQQVGRVSKSLSHRARFRSVCLVDDASALFSKRGTLEGLIDVCISTPARLLGLMVRSSPSTW